MDAKHELGHLTLHAHTPGGSSKRHEDEAKAFAAAFLMPKAPFIASAPRRITLAATLEAKPRWGVSALAYVHRLHGLGRLTDWQYRSLAIQVKSKFGVTEPGPGRARETSRVLAKVLAPSKDGSAVSRKDIAKHLRTHMRDLDEMTFGLTLTPMLGGGKPTPAPSSGGDGLRLVK
jgi:Zn-dependent peptidase ImmA (M78 family)